jgi:hypothetical protein
VEAALLLLLSLASGLDVNEMQARTDRQIAQTDKTDRPDGQRARCASGPGRLPAVAPLLQVRKKDRLHTDPTPSLTAAPTGYALK